MTPGVELIGGTGVLNNLGGFRRMVWKLIYLWEKSSLSDEAVIKDNE